MTQVELWIEKSAFNRTLFLDIKYKANNEEEAEKCEDLANEVAYVIMEQVETDPHDKDGYEFRYYNTQYLKEGKTKESIIEKIWEYQKSLLPDGWELTEFCTYNYIVIFKDTTINGDADFTFYDPSSRIITITDFGGSNECRIKTNI